MGLSLSGVFVGTLLGLLYLLLVVVGLFLYRCRRRNFSRRETDTSRSLAEQETQEEEEDHQLQLENNPLWFIFINTAGLNRYEIDSIPVFGYKKDVGVIEGTECSVCLTEFREDERLKLLPACNHAFHVACIDRWLRAHKNCPLCRAPIVVVSCNAGVSNGSSDRLSGDSTSRNLVDGESRGYETSNIRHEGC